MTRAPYPVESMYLALTVPCPAPPGLVPERIPRTGRSARPDRNRDSRNPQTSGPVSVRSSNRISWYWPPWRRVASLMVSAYRNIIRLPLPNLSSYSVPFQLAPKAFA